MKFTNKDVLPDTHEILRKRATNYEFPLKPEELEEVKGLLEYVKNSINEELAEEFDLSPAVGIAAPQVGISKSAFAVYIEDEDGEAVISEIFINPKLLAYSQEQVYLEGGEACLSVPNPHEGIVPRPYFIKLKYYDIDGNEKIEEFDHFLAIAIQHEYDHLSGVLFYDHINKEAPMVPPPNAHPL